MLNRLYFLCTVSLFVLIVHSNSKRIYKTNYLDVPLDHYSFSNNKTFKLRYLLNDTYWDSTEGPVLFYTGNEGDIELFTEHTGLIWKMAPELKALIIFAEHRYYGKSLPYGNESLTTQNIGYLTSSQAIADYVDVISFILRDKPRNNKNPVIAIGGSYGGMLSAYIRIKYPHIITGALAASAPILQFKNMTNCDAFNRIVTSAFNNTKNCAANIKKSWPIIRNMTSTQPGRDWISKEFNLCKVLKDGEAEIFVDWLIDIYTNLAMVNYPFECDFLAPLPGYPVLTMCQYLDNNTLNNDILLQALSASVSVYTNFTGKTKCNELQTDYVNGLGTEAWDYQACTEMVMPMCSNGVYDMFENRPWNEGAFNDQCKKKWNVKPFYDLAEKEYGGKRLEFASNIIFSNGLLDPWASGGVLRNFSESVVAVIIPEGAHHLDLMEDNPNDPFSVKWARKYHQQTIEKWIKQHKANKKRRF